MTLKLLVHSGHREDNRARLALPEARLNRLTAELASVEVPMFRALSGFTARYHYFTLLVISEFNEWKILLYGNGVTVHGSPKFGEAKAKEHAMTMARAYIHEYRREDLPVLPDVEWTPAAEDAWLVWRGPSS